MCFLSASSMPTKKVLINVCVHRSVYIFLNTHNGPLICSNYPCGVSQSKPRNVDTELTHKLKFMSQKGQNKEFEPSWIYRELTRRGPNDINCSGKWLWNSVPPHLVLRFTPNQESNKRALEAEGRWLTQDEEDVFLSFLNTNLVESIEKGSWRGADTESIEKPNIHMYMKKDTVPK